MNELLSSVTYHCAAVVHVVHVSVRVGAEVEAGSDSGERSSARQSESAVDGFLFKFHLIGVRFRRHALVKRRYGCCEPLQFILNVHFLVSISRRNYEIIIRMGKANGGLRMLKMQPEFTCDSSLSRNLRRFLLRAYLHPLKNMLHEQPNE